MTRISKVVRYRNRDDLVDLTDVGKGSPDRLVISWTSKLPYALTMHKDMGTEVKAFIYTQKEQLLAEQCFVCIFEKAKF